GLHQDLERRIWRPRRHRQHRLRTMRRRTRRSRHRLRELVSHRVEELTGQWTANRGGRVDLVGKHVRRNDAVRVESVERQRGGGGGLIGALPGGWTFVGVALLIIAGGGVGGYVWWRGGGGFPWWRRRG